MTRNDIQVMMERVLSLGYDFTENSSLADVIIINNGSNSSSLTNKEFRKCKPTLQTIKEDMFFAGR